MASLSGEDAVRASIHFLERDELYNQEKPYTIRYALPDNIPRTNSQHEEKHGILIQNIRPQVAHYSLETNGFCVIKMSSAMTYQDFETDDHITDIYLAEVARKLRETLKARHVQVYEHTLRRRDAAYPISTGKIYAFDQPTNTAHIDVTEDYIKRLVVRLNGSRASSMARHYVECINVWKPLKGPLRDWPLTVCDATTVNAKKDLVASDQVFPRHVVENIQVHFNPEQKWYYLQDQMPDELWLFKQGGSRSGSDLHRGSFHSDVERSLRARELMN